MPKKTFFNLPQDKQKRIIDVAYDMFIEEEYEKVSIKALTKRAGIAIGSFYKYFEDKDELYLYLVSSITRKIYTREKENNKKLMFIKDPIPLEDVCTEKEIMFDYTWHKVPVEVVRKYYFGEYGKEINDVLYKEFLELKKADKVKDCVDFDFVFFMYTTTMFNITVYFRKHNITDSDEMYKIKNEFYTNLFLNGILK